MCFAGHCRDVLGKRAFVRLLADAGGGAAGQRRGQPGPYHGLLLHHPSGANNCMNVTTWLALLCCGQPGAHHRLLLHHSAGAGSRNCPGCVFYVHGVMQTALQPASRLCPAASPAPGRRTHLIVASAPFYAACLLCFFTGKLALFAVAFCACNYVISPSYHHLFLLPSPSYHLILLGPSLCGRRPCPWASSRPSRSCTRTNLWRGRWVVLACIIVHHFKIKESRLKPTPSDHGSCYCSCHC